MLKVAYIRDVEAPVRRPSKKQERGQQVRDLGELFTQNHFERELAKELAIRGISRAQYEAMREAVEAKPRMSF